MTGSMRHIGGVLASLSCGFVHGSGPSTCSTLPLILFVCGFVRAADVQSSEFPFARSRSGWIYSLSPESENGSEVVSHRGFEVGFIIATKMIIDRDAKNESTHAGQRHEEWKAAARP